MWKAHTLQSTCLVFLNIYFCCVTAPILVLQASPVCRRVRIPKRDVQDCHSHDKLVSISLILGSNLHPLILPLSHFSHLLLIYVPLQYSMYKDIFNTFKIKWSLVKIYYYFLILRNNQCIIISQLDLKVPCSSQEGLLITPCFLSLLWIPILPSQMLSIFQNGARGTLSIAFFP